MMRIFLTYVLPILLPSLLYVGWLFWRGAKAGPDQARPDFADVPWSWLIGIGVAFALIIAVGTSLMGEGDVGKTYVPPHLDEKGNIVPGQFR